MSGDDKNILQVTEPKSHVYGLGQDSGIDTDSYISVSNPPRPDLSSATLNLYAPKPGLERKKTNNYKNELEAQQITSDRRKSHAEVGPLDQSQSSPVFLGDAERRHSEQSSYEYMQPELFKRRASQIKPESFAHRSTPDYDFNGDDNDTDSIVSNQNSNAYTSGQKPRSSKNSHSHGHGHGLLPHGFIHDLKEKLKTSDNSKIGFHSPFAHSSHGQGHKGFEQGDLSSVETTPKNSSSTEVAPGLKERSSFSFNDYKKDMYRKSISGTFTDTSKK